MTYKTKKKSITIMKRRVSFIIEIPFFEKSPLFCTQKGSENEIRDKTSNNKELRL